MKSIQEIVEARGIKEVLHFTTNVGLLGVLATKSVLSRERLPKENYLEHVYTPNCVTRRDTRYLDYVNLSISGINYNLYDICSNSWHKGRDVWWCIMSFDPAILSHDGVIFTTTNNMYSNVSRASGASGLESLFAATVMTCQRSSVIQLHRPHTLLPCYPTCPQAEALYPKAVSIEFLRKIYVFKQDFEFAICGQCAALNLPQVDVVVKPAAFCSTRG